MYLPISTTLRGVEVVNNRGRVPLRCSSMMLRAGVAAPKSVKNSIIPTSICPAVLGRLAVPPGVTGGRDSNVILLAVPGALPNAPTRAWPSSLGSGK